MLFVGWMVLITSLSLFSFSDDGEDIISIPHLDKMVHAAFHFGIVVLGAFFLNEAAPKFWSWTKRIVLLLTFSLFYGGLIELLQWLLPFDRSAEVLDVFANFSGAVLGGLLIQRKHSLIDRLK